MLKKKVHTQHKHKVRKISNHRILKIYQFEIHFSYTKCPKTIHLIIVKYNFSKFNIGLNTSI